jgi:prolyl oligopeptidase
VIGLMLWLGGASMAAEDPFLWLEEVEGKAALEWVETQNAESLGELKSAKGYAALESRLLGILDSKDRIPFVSQIGGQFYNFWQDAEHPKGIWRRTTPASYRTATPAWEVVLDLDALAKADGQSWVWHGASCLPPEERLCLVALSPGGSDADVTREFDLTTRAFVDGGFTVPESKHDVSWIDADHLLVSADLGPGTTTASGYARQVREWTRGTPLASAPVIFEGEESDVAVSGWVDHTPGFQRVGMYRAITFYSGELWVRGAGGLVRVDVPLDAQAGMHREWLTVELRSDWDVGGTLWPAGSLLVTRLDAFLKGERTFQALFTPTERSALAGYIPTHGTIVVNELVDVRNKVWVWRHGDGGWARAPMSGLPELGSVGVSAVDPEHSDEVFVTVTDLLTPTTLAWADLASGRPPEPLKALPALFDAAGLSVEQRWATSADGTKVPYFLVMRAGLKPNGKTPTLLYGYGGFEVSLTPSYSAATGAAWLERGGAYALANIRGGGEFGPRWHQAALKEHRHRAYEDFAAVARDLIASKVTKAKHLGAMGGSNGGLLMGNMLVQYPELFGAIVCQVPLLDMRRYHTLLAGASWMGEYGDPDDPEQWKFIQGFSPYQLAKADARYPRVLFTTSTRDDRVHPGHARKMVARLKEQGHDVLYWENTEGGHGGAANNAQRAQMWALSWTFLWNELK